MRMKTRRTVSNFCGNNSHFNRVHAKRDTSFGRYYLVSAFQAVFLCEQKDRWAKWKVVVESLLTGGLTFTKWCVNTGKNNVLHTHTHSGITRFQGHIFHEWEMSGCRGKKKTEVLRTMYWQGTSRSIFKRAEIVDTLTLLASSKWFGIAFVNNERRLC